MHCTAFNKISNITSENYIYIMHMLSLLLPLCYNSLEVRVGLYQVQFKNALENIYTCSKMPWNPLKALELAVFVLRTTDMVELVAWKVNVEISPQSLARMGENPVTTPS